MEALKAGLLRLFAQANEGLAIIDSDLTLLRSTCPLFSRRVGGWICRLDGPARKGWGEKSPSFGS